jgi:hypothetical protein
MEYVCMQMTLRQKVTFIRVTWGEGSEVLHGYIRPKEGYILCRKVIYNLP